MSWLSGLLCFLCLRMVSKVWKVGQVWYTEICLVTAAMWPFFFVLCVPLHPHHGDHLHLSPSCSVEANLRNPGCEFASSWLLRLAPSAWKLCMRVSKLPRSQYHWHPTILFFGRGPVVMVIISSGTCKLYNELKHTHSPDNKAYSLEKSIIVHFIHVSYLLSSEHAWS